ncbi:uncharacterized protein LOC132185448 [Corylus avellana]|uniref:uncharacterized protein LOC132185448 n=1 Tax=Corylus avellana TaxID=13451 RepID=UPI00286A2AC6|nr:uncharacterized protein LOC132185448 [Corylus avellana]
MQRISIDKLKLQIHGSSDYALMNRLIGYVPKSFVEAKSITELALYEDEFYNYKPALLLVHVDKQIVQTVIASFPVAEEITFDCYGLKNIYMSGLPKLITFVLLPNPTLESFEMEAPNLKKLTLNLPNLTDKWLHSILSKYPLIESLSLITCKMLKRIKISSDRMKSLTICHCKKLVEVDIAAPNLHKLSYKFGDVISISSNTLALSEVILIFKSNNAPLDAEKIEFLAKLNHPKLLTWIITYVKNVIAPKELRETLRSPSYNVKQLKLTIEHLCEIYEITELVDALLWIFPLLETHFIQWTEDDNRYYNTIHEISFQFSYENHVRKGENLNCCKFLPVSCWRHCLKTIKIEESEASAYVKPLETYFIKNAEILRSIQYSEGLVLLKQDKDQELEL